MVDRIKWWTPMLPFARRGIAIVGLGNPAYDARDAGDGPGRASCGINQHALLLEEF
jgi:hypothetical protein